MGGLPTDEEGQTDVPGLFACGEMVWGLHGANRMGGNALMECLVSGRIAGEGAARLAADTPSGSAVAPVPRGAAPREPADLRELRRQLRQAAWRCAGVIRCAEGMAAGLAQATEIAARLATAAAASAHQRIARDDLRSGVFSLRAVLAAGLPRLESRGCFIRADHPDQDDAAWRRNSRLAWDPASDRFTVTYVPPAQERPEARDVG
jgi:succinate dehydrogenase/fumarate reductase flavoprotein subunit